MHFLSIEQIELLKLLMDHEYMKPSDLMFYLDFSLRKIQLEIKEINATFNERSFPFSIENKRNEGYYLESSDDIALDKLKLQVKKILENSVIRKVNTKRRVSKIVRTLLLNDHYVKSDDLADELNISQATLSLDLKEVREILDIYDLHLESKPYYGLKLEGSTMKQISAYLDLFDYFGIKTNENIITQEVQEELGFSDTDYLIAKTALNDALKAHHYNLSTSGYLRVINLMLIIQFKKLEGLDLVSLNLLDHFIEYKIATQLYTDKQTILLLTYYLIANVDLDTQFTQSTYFALYKRSEEVFDELEKALMTKINLDFNVKNKNAFLGFFIKYSIRRKFDIKEYNTFSSLIEIIYAKPATLSLTSMIYTIISPNPQRNINESLFYDLGIIIYNEAYTFASGYEQIKGLVASDYGVNTGAAIIERIQKESNRFDIKYEVVPSYHLEHLNLSQYDFVINTSNIYALESDETEVFNSNYFLAKGFAHYFWSKVIMKKRKENHILDQLVNVETHKLKATNVTLISLIHEHLEKHHIKIEHYFEYMSCFLNEQKYDMNKTCQIVLFTKEEVSNAVFLFELENPLTSNLKRTQTIALYILNLNNKLLSIKQIDSTIKRFNPNHLD